MKNKMASCSLLLGLLAFGTCFAGYDEGLAAANKGDYVTALKEWRPLADQGNVIAQYNLGVMYDDGKGVPQDFTQAVAWFRKAAEQGYALAQSHLAEMYSSGKGVPQEYVIAYALFNLSANKNQQLGNETLYELDEYQRDELASKMSEVEIKSGQALTRKMILNGVAEAISRHLKDQQKKTPQNKKTFNPAHAEIEKQFNRSWPEKPAHQVGFTNCNTQCNNGDCMRTYDDGRHVRLNLSPSIDPFTGEMKFNPPPCK